MVLDVKRSKSDRYLQLAAAFLGFGGFWVTVTHVQYWKWTFDIDSPYLLKAAWFPVLMTVVIICTIQLVSD